jgi:hypothetical protein
MKKTKKHLAIALEIIRALSPASLADALGGMSELCTRRPCPSSSCPPPPSN